MKRIKAVLGKKWTYLLLLVALGWIFWLWILPYRYTAMALWGIAGFMTFWPTWGANILLLPGA